MITHWIGYGYKSLLMTEERKVISIEGMILSKIKGDMKSRYPLSRPWISRYQLSRSRRGK